MVWRSWLSYSPATRERRLGLESLSSSRSASTCSSLPSLFQLPPRATRSLVRSILAFFVSFPLQLKKDVKIKNLTSYALNVQYWLNLTGKRQKLRNFISPTFCWYSIVEFIESFPLITWNLVHLVKKNEIDDASKKSKMSKISPRSLKPNKSSISGSSDSLYFGLFVVEQISANWNGILLNCFYLPGKYYLVCIMMVALSLIITTLVLTLHHHATVKPVPEKVTKILLLTDQFLPYYTGLSWKKNEMVKRSGDYLLRCEYASQPLTNSTGGKTF